MPAPANPPLGLVLAGTARAVGRAFDEALVAAGGSLPVWSVLLQLTVRGSATQRELSAAIGITEATMSHHLSALEGDGLVARDRAPGNRRTVVVTLTDDGRALFGRLREAAAAFDRRLRGDLPTDRVRELTAILQVLASNVAERGRAAR